jgi:tetratricopeptide (TPR) repeat protein
MNVRNEDANHEITLREALTTLIEQMRFAAAGQFAQPWAEEVIQELLRAAQQDENAPIDRIIEKRFQTAGQLPDADERKAFLNGLKGIWLEATQKPVEAAAAYYGAGRIYSGLESYDVAEQLLTRAKQLNPGDVPTYWDLAQAWLMLSYRTDAPDVEEILSKGIATWESGAALALPDNSSSWTYVSRAFMNERLAELHPERGEELWWEACVYLERAILLNDWDAVRWASLARYHRCLNNEFSAVQVTREALERDPDNSSALEERVAILANVGEFDLAEQALARLQSQPSGNENTWVQGVKAYVLAHKRQYAQAMQVIEDVIQKEGVTIWNLDLQALCLRMVGERARAEQVYGEIWKIYEASDNLADDDKSACAWAAYSLGKLDQAIEILERLADNHLQAANAYRTLGLCYLAKGDPRAEEYLQRGIEGASSQSDLDAFLIIQLSECEGTPTSRANQDSPTATLTRIKARIQARQAELQRPPAEDKNATEKAAQRELARVVAPFEGPEGMQRWAWIGAQAGLARLHSQAEQWRQAATVYQGLWRATTRFPEARLGIEKAIENLRAEAQRYSKDKNFLEAASRLETALAFETQLSRADKLPELHQELGNALWKGKQNSEALQQFNQALALRSEAGPSAQRADLHVSLGLVQQELKGEANARASFITSLSLYGEAGTQNAGEAFANACRPLLRSARHFWEIESLLKGLGEEPAMEEPLRNGFAQARESLLPYLDELYRLAPAAVTLSIVTPIVLEVGTRLVPKVDPKSDGGKFLSDIDGMRKHIEAGMGIKVPGVRMRENPGIAQNSYVIMLDEVPIARGSVQIGMGYCPAPAHVFSILGISTDGLVEAQDPASGRTGYWVSPDHREAIESSKSVEWRTDTAFVLSHLEDVLHQNLAIFLGLHEVAELLTNEAKREKSPAFIEAMLADVSSRLRCARVLRALVREGVPITELRSILEAVQAQGLSDIDASIRAVRLRLCRQLPGNRMNRQQIEIPEEWEGLLTQQEGKIVFSASPEATLRLLLQVRNWMESRDRDVVLVTRNAALRPFLRRLVEFEFPYVAVLSREEKLRPEALPAA